MVGLFFTTASFSQQHKAFYYAGLTFSRPAYFPVGESNRVTGVDVDFQREQFFMKKFSWTVNAGYVAFWGTYNFRYYKSFYSAPKDSTINQYSFIPLSSGLKFHWGHFNIGCEAGGLISLNKYSSGYPFFAAGIGYKINKDKKHSIDLNLRLINTLRFGTPEDYGLAAGGYGMWEFRFAYRFLKAGTKE